MARKASNKKLFNMPDIGWVVECDYKDDDPAFYMGVYFFVHDDMIPQCVQGLRTAVFRTKKDAMNAVTKIKLNDWWFRSKARVRYVKVKVHIVAEKKEGRTTCRR